MQRNRSIRDNISANTTIADLSESGIKHLTVKSRRKYNLAKGGLKKQLQFLKTTPNFNYKCPNRFDDVHPEAKKYIEETAAKVGVTLYC